MQKIENQYDIVVGDNFKEILKGVIKIELKTSKLILFFNNGKKEEVPIKNRPKSYKEKIDSMTSYFKEKIN